MIWEKLLDVLLLPINQLLDSVPHSVDHLPIPDLSGLGRTLYAADGLVPFLLPVSILVGAICVLLPPFAVAKVALFIYHQFWGSS